MLQFFIKLLVIIYLCFLVSALKLEEDPWEMNLKILLVICVIPMIILIMVAFLRYLHVVKPPLRTRLSIQVVISSFSCVLLALYKMTPAHKSSGFF